MKKLFTTFCLIGVLVQSAYATDGNFFNVILNHSHSTLAVKNAANDEDKSLWRMDICGTFGDKGWANFQERVNCYTNDFSNGAKNLKYGEYVAQTYQHTSNHSNTKSAADMIIGDKNKFYFTNYVSGQGNGTISNKFYCSGNMVANIAVDDGANHIGNYYNKVIVLPGTTANKFSVMIIVLYDDHTRGNSFDLTKVTPTAGIDTFLSHNIGSFDQLKGLKFVEDCFSQ